MIHMPQIQKLRKDLARSGYKGRGFTKTFKLDQFDGDKDAAWAEAEIWLAPHLKSWQQRQQG